MFRKNNLLCLLLYLGLGCTQTPPITITATTLPEYQEQLSALVESDDPSLALETLASLMKTDTFALNNCHEILHEVGETALNKYGFIDAVSFQDDLCNSGFIHGVIEAYFENAEDITVAMQEVCAGLEEPSLTAWECFHGTGHGFMLATGTDLDASLALCAEHTTTFEQNACVNGVYMEVFTLDDVSRDYYLPASTDALSFCTEMDTGRSDCFTYAPTLYLKNHPGDFEGLITWCLGALNDDRAYCIAGAGSEMMKRSMGDPAHVETSCMKTEEHLVPECLMGAVTQAMFHIADADEVQSTVCGTWSSKNKKGCRRAVDFITDHYHIE